jgi:hypothetical protein
MEGRGPVRPAPRRVGKCAMNQEEAGSTWLRLQRLLCVLMRVAL